MKTSNVQQGSFNVQVNTFHFQTILVEGEA